MPYLVDTSWAIQALRGNQAAAEDLQRIAFVRPSPAWVTLAELYEQAFRSTNLPAAMQVLSRFRNGYRVLYPNDALAERFAELRAYLRGRGQPIPDFDIVIAATAMQYDLTLLTFDSRHFNRIPDLRLYEVERG